MTREEEIKKMEEMIANGEIGSMTECAYGAAIADDEQKNVLNKKKKEEE
jgi:hypothetical protein